MNNTRFLLAVRGAAEAHIIAPGATFSARCGQKSRRALLLGTALSAAVASMALTTPRGARAANECGTGAVVTCTPTGNPYPNGITYFPALNTDQTINLQSGVTVNSTGSYYGGLSVFQSGAGAINVNGPTGVSITSGPGALAGVALFGTYGAINANVNQISTSGDNVYGLIAGTVNGAVNLTAGTVVTTGANAVGVEGETNSADVTINAGSVTTSGAGATGILASSFNSGSGNITVTAGTVKTSGAAADGIDANTTFGNTTVNAASVTTSGDGSRGIYADSATKAVTVNSGSVVTSGANATGILARGGTGSVNVTAANVTTSGAGSRGVDAYTGSGVANVVVNGAIVTHGDNAPGVVVSSATGSVSVTGPSTSSVSTTGNYSRGVDARALGAGGTVFINIGTVTTGGLSGSVFGPDSTGIFAQNHDGKIAVNAASVSTAGAFATGINANSYSGSINVAAGSVTTGGANANAIGAVSNYGGDVRVSSATISTAGDLSNGIYALARGGSISISGGNVSTQGFDARGVYAYAGKGVAVDFGNIATTGGFATGVDAESATGNVVVNGTSVTTGGVDALGVYATSKTGNASATVGSVSTSGGNGIGVDVQAPLGAAYANVGNVTTTGSIGGAGVVASGVSATVVSTGSIQTAGSSAYGDSGTGVLVTSTTGAASASVNHVAATGLASRGVDVQSASGPVQVVISGAVSSAQADAVYAKSVATAPIAITVAAGGSVGAPTAFAIDTAGGPATINNAGALDGAIRLAGGGDTVNNAGAFNAVGNSLFAAGDVFNNAGAVNILAGAQPAAGNVTFSGLASFNNTGLINLSNGRVGDTFTLPGVAFNGGAGSLLALDVNFGGTGTQASCAAPTLADCLVLPGGSATGVTGVRITNIGTGPSLATNGIVVVDAPGGSIAAGAFVLDPASRGFETRGGAGAVSSGFFFYRLVPIGTTQEALVSAPDNTAFEFTQFGVAATDVWYTTTGTWFDREADLREGFSDQGTSGGHGDVWLKMVGDWSRRNSSQSTTSLGTTFTFDTSYKQSTAAIIGGADLLRGSSRAFVLGVDGGYVDSDVRFNASPTYARLRGGVVGGYASLLSGGWYLDATVNYNFLTLDDTIPSVINPAGTGLFATSGHVRSLGGQVESGWRLALGSFSVEPLASLAYVRTRFDDLAIPGGAVQFGDVDSFRGSLGLRLSSEIRMADYKIKPSVFARAWDEFRGDENTALINAGPSVTGFDRFRGVFGDVGGQMAVFGKGAVAAFINGDYKFKSNYRDYTATVGIRYQF